MSTVSRRDFLATGALAAGALAFGPAFWRDALAAVPALPGAGPYGPLGPPDANGISLPVGFSARELARAAVPVPGTAYPWHIFPDGMATYSVTDGGWVLVSNSESLAATGAGASAVRFDAGGNVVDAYRILLGTNGNCAGGRTPWGAWLSCEEFDGGQVWECDPLGRQPALNRPAMGIFNHEAAAVDPVGKRIYMTEDKSDGCFYRFTPTLYPSLTSGLLEVLVGAPGGPVTWAPVPDPSAITGGPTRGQVPTAAKFTGGEGIWFDSGFVYFSTKGDSRIWSLDTRTDVLDVLFDGKASPDAGLTGLDNLTVSRSGDMFVCEDNGEDEYSVGIITRERVAARFLTVSGPNHAGSELAGVIFDPSGTRMYFSSQRGYGAGVTYEITGPFRTDPPPGAVASDADPLDPNAPVVARDVASGLKISAAKRISMATLLRRGVAVNVSVKAPGVVTIALRSDDLDRVPGERGSTERPKPVTLATARRTFTRAGRHQILLKPRGGIRRRLKGHGTITARYTVQARAKSGSVELVNRRVRVSGSSGTSISGLPIRP
jgi:hypothetical protein